MALLEADVNFQVVKGSSIGSAIERRTKRF
jgi:hypothetical protein